MYKLNLLIIEDDESSCKSYKRIIKEIPDFELIAVTGHVNEAISIMRDSTPDAIILDLELHAGSGNGIDILTNLKEFPYHPYVLVTTYNPSNITYEIVRKLGADFIMYKHESGYTDKTPLEFLFNIKDILLNKSDIQKKDIEPTYVNDFYEKKINIKITDELNRIGIPHDLKGFNYLREGIKLITNNETYNLFNNIGKIFNKTPNSVERAMQTAINKTWNTTDIEVLAKNYTAPISPKKDAPTVTEFVHYYADKIKNEI